MWLLRCHENTLYRLTTPLGRAGGRMSTTAVVAVTRRTAGGATPSGGPGPVLPLAHSLAEEPAEFTAHTWQHTHMEED